MSMKREVRWLIGAVLICGLWLFVACASDDIPTVVPDMEQLQDGEWTGSGEGRSGSIIVKDTQVLKADGTPIPGLYAAGEVTGGLHGANRLGGNGVADIVVNGRLAGQIAARKVKD